MKLDADQVVLLAAVAHRPRTPGELAVTLRERPAEIERGLRVLKKLTVVDVRMDTCPLCRHAFGGRLYSATSQGLLVLAESPLVRKAAA